MILIGILAYVPMVCAQNPYCMGLKNPQNFTVTGGPANPVWEGMTGTKQGTASSCSAHTIGSNFSTTVPANQLHTISSGSSCVTTSSVDINGQSDGMRRFVIKGAGYDDQTLNNLSYLPPDTSFHSSVRLGNFCGGTEAEMLTYTFTVDVQNMIVTIWYALSLEDAGHDAANNPEFVIMVEKQVNGNWVAASGDTLCYVQPTPVSGQGLGVFSAGIQGSRKNCYLQWQKVLINLSKYQFQRIRIKLAAGDCGYSMHYACCYFAGECQGMELKAVGCAAGETDSVARIAAPKGANQYKWYRSKTGMLSNEQLYNDNNYDLINGAEDSVLYCTVNQFINYTNPTHYDTMIQNSFMCEMTTYMNPSRPVKSKIYTSVGNTKPFLVVDSTHDCNAGITLMERSFTPYPVSNDDYVDTAHTKWYFYSTYPPTPQSLVDSAEGSVASHTFPNAGYYGVRVRTSAFNSDCWNEKSIKVKTFKSPVPQVSIERNNLCEGDTIIMIDLTMPQQMEYHRWTIGDTMYTTNMASTRVRFDSTTVVNLSTRGNQYYMADTTGDGIVERVYCYADTTFTVFVNEYPKLTVTGDTIVCNGTEAIVNVSSQSNENRYDWFTSMQGNNPIQGNTATLTTMPTQDQRFYVRATSPFGCTSWDSINIYIVDPQLYVPVTEICDNTTIKLYASNAYSYTWTSMPDDPSMAGQTHNDTLVVTPHQNTTYSLVGHGMNNCSTVPLTQTVRVFPYPVPTVEMSPTFIDSEEPVITFRDVSPGATTSLWNFGNGNTSTERQIRYTFTDLSEDSVLVSLTTGNELNCTSDTSFYIPVEIFAVWFPNAITPTLSTNRTFKVFTHNQLEFYSLYIYNRDGVLVFKSNDQNKEWDGRYNGKYCPQGVYVYTCTYRRPGTSDIVTNRGTVTIIQ